MTIAPAGQAIGGVLLQPCLARTALEARVQSQTQSKPVTTAATALIHR